MSYSIKTAHCHTWTNDRERFKRQKNAVVDQDDIFFRVFTKEQLNSKTDLALNRLERVGMTIDEKKYIHKCKNIVSWKIDFEGRCFVSTSFNRGNVRIKMQYFSRLFNFYRRYLSKYSDWIEPFANFNNKKIPTELVWTKKQLTNFDNLNVPLLKKIAIMKICCRWYIGLRTDIEWWETTTNKTKTQVKKNIFSFYFCYRKYIGENNSALGKKYLGIFI